MARPRRTNISQAHPMPADAGIGGQIVDRRLALGLTQQMLADLAGVSRSTIQALEYGGGSVKLAALTATADALGLDVALTAKGRG